MQTIAQSWLVLELTGSATALGAVDRPADPADAGARPVRGRRRRPRGQAPADDRPADRDGRAGAGARPPDDHRRSSRSGRSTCWPLLLGLEQLLREPGPAVVRAGDGRPRRPAQRREPQLGDGQRRPGGRARRSRASSSPPAASALLPAQRGELRRGGRLAARGWTRRRCSPRRPRPRAPGQLREGLRYVRAHPRARRAAADDGAGRLPGLRVPGRAAGRGARRRSTATPDLRLHDRGDGRRRGGRRAVRGRRAGAPGCARSWWRRRLFGLAMLGAAAAPTLPLELVAMALVGASSVAFLSHGQQHAAARRGPADARPGDGAVGGGLPGVDADRRARSPGLVSEHFGGRAGSCWAPWRASSRPRQGRWWCGQRRCSLRKLRPRRCSLRKLRSALRRSAEVVG